MIRTGLDALLADPRRLSGRRYGLLAHAASVDSDRLEPIHLALRRAGADDPVALFGPEHGYHGVEQDMVGLEDAVDPWIGVHVVSLYGDSEASLKPQPAAFEGLDLLVVDLQDVGSRYYTYAATAVWAAEAALAAGCDVWILDRPNPLGGEVVEGNRRRPGYESFVGAFEIPVRHGLTLGELVLLEAQRAGWERSPEIVALEGWQRGMTWAYCGRAWLPPSPNLPTAEACQVYPGACLVEATELSEGRGTTTPFELVGAPGVDALELADRLNALELPGLRFLPTYFRPQFQKHAGRLCGGVRSLVVDPRAASPYRMGVELIVALHSVFGDGFAWRREAYEFEEDRPAIDLLTGDDRLRLALAGEADLAEWLATWAGDEEAFRDERREVLLYPEGDG
jgi:uncharacterized protein YbbC (DUF1343 family)